MDGKDLRRAYTYRFAPGQICSEGQLIDVCGVNPWEHEWIRLDKPPIKLSHPSYPHEMHEMWFYRVEAGDRKIVFAAGELSPNVWGFYPKLD